MNIIPRISVFLVNRVFNTRYKLASMTRRHRRFSKLVQKIAFKGDDMSVLPKNGTAHKVVDLNINIENADEKNVVPSDLVKKVLRRSDKIFIMNFCLCRQANKCKDYPVERGCMFLGEATVNIPPEYGRFVTPDEACDYIDECGRLGLVHIIGKNKLDRVWLHTGNKLSFMTICNCCPCCCLWNMVRDIDDEISAKFKRMEGVAISVDSEKCIGCGICYESCFVRAIKIENGKCVLDDAKCRGCGRCSEACPVKAIDLTYDPSVIDSEADRIYRMLSPEKN